MPTFAPHSSPIVMQLVTCRCVSGKGSSVRGRSNNPCVKHENREERLFVSEPVRDSSGHTETEELVSHTLGRETGRC